MIRRMQGAVAFYLAALLFYHHLLLRVAPRPPVRFPHVHCGGHVFMYTATDANGRVRQGMAWYAAPFVRPLLGVRKPDLVDFLRERGQEWREDGSNQVAKVRQKSRQVRRAVVRLIPFAVEVALLCG